MKKLNKQLGYLLLMIGLSSIHLSLSHASDFNRTEAIKKFQKEIKSDDYICKAPLDIYVNDEVILGGKATFEEFTRVFPSNREHYMQMYGFYTVEKESKSFYCSGRYYGMNIELKGEIYKHWASLYTDENAVEWYKITFANLAGAAEGGDGYYLFIANMPHHPEPMLKALKSFPLSTQRILVNLKEMSDYDEELRGYKYQKGYIFPTPDKECDSEYCNYIRSLIDDDYKLGVYYPNG